MNKQRSKPKNYLGKVIEKKFLKDEVVFARVEHKDPEKLEFQSGQYCTFKIDEDTHRAYSIGSSGKEHDYIDLYVDITPDGPGSHFFENLEEGQEVEYIAPQGRFVYEETEGKVCFVSTGTGIVPFLSMIDHAIDDGYNEKITLLQGNSFIKDVFIKDKLDKLAKEHGNFEYRLCITREISDFTHKCRVTDYLDKKFDTEFDKNTDFYICGYKGMVNDVEKILKDKGVPAENIKYEKY